jgi:hypothetical protein
LRPPSVLHICVPVTGTCSSEVDETLKPLDRQRKVYG